MIFRDWFELVLCTQGFRMRRRKTKRRHNFVSRINADKEVGNWMSWWKKFLKPKQNFALS